MFNNRWRTDVLACRLAVRYFSQSPAPHQHIRGHDAATTPAQVDSLQPLSVAAPSDSALAFASLSLLHSSSELRRAWGAGPFLGLLRHADHAVRWAAIQVLSLQLGLGDAESQHLLDKHLTVSQQAEASAAWQARAAATQLQQSLAWTHDPAHCPHCRQYGAGPGSTSTTVTATGTARTKGSKRKGGDGAVAAPQAPTTLPPAAGYVEVAGIELPHGGTDFSNSSDSAGTISTGGSKRQGSKSKGLAGGELGHTQPATTFVSTPTVERNLRAAALALCAGRPLLLEGPPGCGKTALAERLAQFTGNAGTMVGAGTMYLLRGCATSCVPAHNYLYMWKVTSKASKIGQPADIA
jgi:hypothetical protein